MQKRFPVKEDTRRPIDMQAKGLIASKPKVNQRRHEIEQVQAWESGHKGASKPKARKWY